MKAFAPNGAEIIGTCDLIPGNALISSFTRLPDGSIEVDWAGDTDVCYDGQETKTDWRGLTIYVDENGNEWPEDAISIEGETPKDAPNPSRDLPAMSLKSLLLTVAAIVEVGTDGCGLTARELADIVDDLKRAAAAQA